MSAKLQTGISAHGAPSEVPAAGRLLQRRCDCGQHTIAGGECSSCEKPVTVWRDKFKVYTIAAGESSKPGEDVDHIKDKQGQWYKIGWNTVTVDATGKVYGHKCKVPNYGEDCGTPELEKPDRPLAPPVSSGVNPKANPGKRLE